ncbi:MAG: class I fructose-bisphosphate aldolase [Alphaproteobacteria bacterium]
MSGAPRLSRLLGDDGRCLDVAIDHGVFAEPGFLPGIEDMERAVETVVRAAPDAVQLGPGHAGLLQSRPGRAKPALVLRVDVTNVYGATLSPPPWCELVGDPLEAALRLDAAAVVVFLLEVPGHGDLHRQCVANLVRLAPECRRFGMPLMVEPLAMKVAGGALAGDFDPARIGALVRQAVELGADVIKADPPSNPADLSRIVELCGGRPLLVRGGGKASEDEILRRTHAVMAAGASGIVYGRNVIQHRDPAAMTRAFMAIVHDGATPEAAARLLAGG